MTNADRSPTVPRHAGGLLCAVVLILIAWGCGPSKAQQQQAVTAITPWLELVDSGQHEESWKRTGDYFKRTIPAAAWDDLMRSYRQPLGRTLSRSMKSVRQESSLPGAPDANYIVVKFDTVFERKKKAVETVITIAGENGMFTVVGYYVE